MIQFIKDFYYAIILLKREGIKSFMHRLYWYLKGKRLIEEITAAPPLDNNFQPDVDDKKYYSARVLFVSHDAQLAGAQILLLNLIEWFVKFTSWDIKIICLDGGVLEHRFETLAPTLIWSKHRKLYPEQSQKEKVIKEFAGDVDLIYGNTVIASRFYHILQILNAPIISHIHELEITISTLLKPDALDRLHKFSSAFIACSPAVADNLEKNHLINPVPLAAINAFIKPLNIDFVTKTKQEIRGELDLKTDDFTVFCCGTVDWRKGADLFVEAAIELKRRGYTDFHFYWIGSNKWDKSQLNIGNTTWADIQNRIESNGIADNIEFLGVKDNPREYFLGGDCFFLSSREDPFPLVALEAAECKLPVICFEGAGGMPAFVKDEAGFVVPFKDVNAAVDKIIYLIENPDEKTVLGESARKKVLNNHIVDIAAPQILRFSQEIGNFHPAVSIIVPNYNYENYLRKRLNTIINQTFKDFELIILDDASTDNSLEIIREYEHLPNVQVITNEKNSGNTFHQWKKGLESAKAEIIWIAEADDYSEPTFLESLINEFYDPEVVIAYCNSHVINEKDEITRDYKEYYDMLDVNHWQSDYKVNANSEINFGLGVKNSIPNVSAVLMRKTALQADILDNALNYKLSGDWFIYTSILHNKKIAFKKQKLNYHRKHDQTQTSDAHKTGNKRLILDEADRIHNLILDKYEIKIGFSEKWENYITLQIVSLFPNVKKEDFNKYYPFTKMLKKINNLESKNTSKTALIVTHSANRTGAPQLIYHIANHFFEKDGIECIVFSLEDGPLMDDFKRIGPSFVVNNNVLQGQNIPVRDYLQNLDDKPSFALVNTACCGNIIPEIKSAGIPIVTLVHDYTYAWNKNYLKTMYDFTDQIVYSTNFMVEKNIHDYSFDMNKTSVIPQGLYKTDFLERDQKALRKEFRNKLNIDEDAFVVMGSGLIHPRKGVDIFIMAAIQVLANTKKKDFHFIWICSKLESNSPDMYIRFLQRDLINSGNLDKIHFLGQIVDVLPYYALSDLLFLSSREDPFPSIVLESFAVGNPVIGMEGSSGSIELLKRTGNFVAPYGNIAKIAEMILEISENNELREKAGLKGKTMVINEFNFDHYVVKLKKLIVQELNVQEGMFTLMS